MSPKIDYCGCKLTHGKLLERYTDFSHRFAVGHERAVGYDKEYHVHDRINLAFPRSSSIVEFTTKDPKKTFVVDNKSMLWMPAFVEHKQGVRSTIWDNLAIFPSSDLVEESFKLFQKRYGVKTGLPRETVKKTRTVLLNELLNEYYLERVVERKDPEHLITLSNQILEEVFRILVCPKRESEVQRIQTSSDIEGDPYVYRAIRFIETNLFDPYSTHKIANQAGTSPATLFRKFRQELKVTPYEYIVQRRLDESLSLLKGGDHSVSDISLIVGYADLAAFSKAFKKRFGKAPSSYLS